MKAIYVYSNKTGTDRLHKKNTYIIKKLHEIYDDLKVKETSTTNEFSKCVDEACEEDRIFICSGGDGTFNLAINFILKKEKQPLLGYIPLGTINDAGKSLGVKNYKTALKLLKLNSFHNVDIGKYNDNYFAYVMALGQFSDISYITKRNEKKIFGKLSYYRLAVKEALKSFYSLEADIELDDKVIHVKTPQILIMNGLRVGGFPVNFKNSYHDSKMDIYITKPGLCGGLFHYLFFKIKTDHYSSNKVIVKPIDKSLSWCVDGEKGISGDINLEIVSDGLKVLSKIKK